MIKKNLSDYASPDVKLVNNAVTPPTQLSCLQLPTPDALTRLGDIPGATLNGAFRAFFLPGHTLTWRVYLERGDVLFMVL
jgi:hypothetical protein